MKIMQDKSNKGNGCFFLIFIHTMCGKFGFFVYICKPIENKLATYETFTYFIHPRG
jgi:hypothetical protein